MALSCAGQITERSGTKAVVLAVVPVVAVVAVLCVPFVQPADPAAPCFDDYFTACVCSISEPSV